MCGCSSTRSSFSTRASRSRAWTWARSSAPAAIFFTRATEAQSLSLLEVERELLERHEQIADVDDADAEPAVAATADEAVAGRDLDTERFPARRLMQLLVREPMRREHLAAALVLRAVA